MGLFDERYYRRGWNHGEDNPKSKLSADDVLEIRRLHGDEGKKDSEIAKIYGVKPSTISRICDGTSWRHVTSVETKPERSYGFKPKPAKKAMIARVDPEMYPVFAQMHKGGQSYQQIGYEYGLSRNTIYCCIRKWEQQQQKEGVI